MTSKTQAGRGAARRWMGWRVKGPTFPLELIITRRRDPESYDDPYDASGTRRPGHDHFNATLANDDRELYDDQKDHGQDQETP